MTTITTRDGQLLEAAWDTADEADGAVVLCHPHPQQAGTMNAPLMTGLATYLAGDGLAVLRFNFRGVGASTGEWGGGVAEIDDVEAAVHEASTAYPELPLGIAGWSFGAAAALHWQARDGSALPYVGVAPPFWSPDQLPAPVELVTARRRFVIGDRDQFTAAAELRTYADSIGAEIFVLGGSDHFFHFRHDRVGALVAEGVRVTQPG